MVAVLVHIQLRHSFVSLVEAVEDVIQVSWQADFVMIISNNTIAPSVDLSHSPLSELLEWRRANAGAFSTAAA